MVNKDFHNRRLGAVESSVSRRHSLSKMTDYLRRADTFHLLLSYRSAAAEHVTY